MFARALRQGCSPNGGLLESSTEESYWPHCISRARGSDEGQRKLLIRRSRAPGSCGPVLRPCPACISGRRHPVYDRGACLMRRSVWRIRLGGLPPQLPLLLHCASEVPQASLTTLLRRQRLARRVRVSCTGERARPFRRPTSQDALARPSLGSLVASATLGLSLFARAALRGRAPSTPWRAGAAPTPHPRRTPQSAPLLGRARSCSVAGCRA